MPHQVRVDATPVRHELIAIVAIPYEKLGYQTLGLIEPRIKAHGQIGALKGSGHPPN